MRVVQRLVAATVKSCGLIEVVGRTPASAAVDVI